MEVKICYSIYVIVRKGICNTESQRRSYISFHGVYGGFDIATGRFIVAVRTSVCSAREACYVFLYVASDTSRIINVLSPIANVYVCLHGRVV